MYLIFLVVAVRLHREEGGAGPAIALLFANVVTHLLATFHALAAVRLWDIPAAPLWLPVSGGITLAFLWATTERGVGRNALRSALMVAAQALPLFALFAVFSLGRAWPTTAVIAVFSVEFLFVSAIWIVSRRLTVVPSLRGDLAGAFGNAFVFFALLAAAVGMQERSGFVLLCGCALGMAAYHALVGGLLLRGARDDYVRRLVYLALGVTFVTIAVPLQLKGSYITVAWAAESAALIYVGLVAKEARLRWYGATLLMLAAAKALAMDLHIGPERLPFLVNVRMLSGAMLIAASYVAAWLLARGREALSKDEADLPAAFVLIGTALAAVFGSVELWQHVGTSWPAAGRLGVQHLALSLFWSIFAVSVLAIGVMRRNAPLRTLALGVLVLAVGKVVSVDLRIDPEPFRLLLNSRFLAGASVMLAASAAAYLIHSARDHVSKEEVGLAGPLVVAANVLALIFISVDLWEHLGVSLPEAVRASARQLSLSIFWSVYALGGLLVGIWRRNRPVRLFAMGLLYVAIGKVFIFDLSFLEQPYRIVSFLGLGIVLLVVSLLYTRFEERLK